jgi:hypothetical protein
MPFRFPSLVIKRDEKEVSRNLDIGFQISWFPGFYQFLQVSQVEKPLETEMLKY